MQTFSFFRNSYQPFTRIAEFNVKYTFLSSVGGKPIALVQIQCKNISSLQSWQHQTTLRQYTKGSEHFSCPLPVLARFEPFYFKLFVVNSNNIQFFFYALFSNELKGLYIFILPVTPVHTNIFSTPQCSTQPGCMLQMK